MTTPPASRPSAAHVVSIAVVAVALIGGLVAAAVALERHGSRAPVTVKVVGFGPIGAAAPALAPITISFDQRVDHRKVEQALKLDPPVKGTAVWSGNELSYRPAWPGFAPGQGYSVNLGPYAGQNLVKWTFKTSGDLAVQFTTPAPDDSEVDTQAIVTVQFNRPVAALSALAQAPAKTVLVFDPPLSGTGRWLTSALYTFKPDKGLAPSTAYRVSIAPAVSDLPGGELPAAYSFAFSTIRPAVADQFPRDNTQFVDPTSDVRVLFNQPVARASAEQAFQLSRAGVGAAIAGVFTWPDDQTLVFRPAAPLDRGAKLTATVGAGARSAAGSGVSQAATTWSFAVADTPRVEKTDPAPGPAAQAEFGMTVTFNVPMDHDATEAAVVIDPPPAADDKPVFFWGPETTLRINYAFKPSSPYTVSIGAGAKDRFGQALGAPFSAAFTTAPRRASLTIVTQGFGAAKGTLSADAPPMVFLATTNVPQASLSLYRISQADFITLASGRSNTTGYTPPAGSGLRDWSVPLPSQTNETAVTPVNLATDLPAAVNGQLAPGFYALDASAAGVTGRTRLALEVTHTNLLVKRGADSALVWAADLASGQPVAGAAVTLLDAGGRQLASGATGQDGVFEGRFTRTEGQQGGLAIWAALTRENDTALATDDWNESAAPFSFGFPTASFSTPSPLKGYVYTDRPVYRSGETVHARAIVRADDDGRYSLPTSAAGLSAQVRDSRGQQIQSGPLAFDAFGSAALDVTVPAEGATGDYRIEVFNGKDVLASGGFLVAEFRPPEFQVEVKADKAEVVNGATIGATVQADLFFGSPLAGAAVTWLGNAAPYTFRPTDKSLAGYSFADPDAINAQRPAPRPVGSGTLQTDAQGHAAFSVAAQIGDFPTSETFNLSATVTDANRQQVSASTSVIVHKAGVYAGVRPQQYVYRSGQQAALDLVSLDPAGKPAPNTALKADVYLRTWLTAKKRDPDGSERYVSTPNDALQESQNLTTGGDGKATLAFTPAKGGQYRIVVSGRDGAGNPFQAAAFVYVTASETLSWRVNNNDKLDLVADKSEYAPGDTAHILAPAPFAGTKALVTVERGRVLSHQVVDFATNSSTVDVPITADMAPTVYLSVALLKPGAGADAVAAYKLGYVQLPVNPGAHALTVSLTPDKPALGPGESVNFAVNTTDAGGKGVAAEVSLALVDQAILNLADERAQPIFAAFYGPRALGLNTGATLGVSINVANQAFSLTAPGGKGGGGGGDDSAAGNIRSRFENTAFWKADVQTGADGKASVSVKLPDNLTTWRLNARGVTADTLVGEGTTTVVTQRDLVLRPVAPRFFTAGDSAHIEALLNNRTARDLSVTVSLNAEGLSVAGGPQKVTAPANGSVSVGWDTTAGDGASAKLSWEAKSDGDGPADGARLTLPVKDRTTPETVMSAGVLTAGSVTENVVVPGYARTDKGGVILQLSPSLDSLLALAGKYLEDWPYEPADVTAARLLARTANWQTDQKLQKPADQAATDKTAAVRAVGRLIGAQSFDGGWSWWSGYAGEPQISARVLYALGVARAAGLNVDSGALQRAARFLNDDLNKPTDALRPADPNARAFTLLALATANQGSRDRERALTDQRATLNSSGKGALLLALLTDGAARNDPAVRALATDLQSAAVASATGTHWEDLAPTGGGARVSPLADSNSTRATALALSALLTLDPQQPLLEGALRWLTAARADGHWRSPDETGLAVNAVGVFLVAREQPVVGLTYTATLNGKALDVGGPRRPDAASAVTAPLAGLPQDRPLPLEIAKQGGGQVYYGLALRYFTPADGIGALSRGITVGREYLAADGDTPVSAVKAGDLVRVRLTIIAPADLQRVRVEDQLPAGLEAVDGSLKITAPDLLRRQRDDQQRALQQGACATAQSARPGAPASAQPGAPPPNCPPTQLQAVTDRERRLFNPFTHVEARDDRVALFADSLGRGVHEYVYYARATTPGAFAALPAMATESDYPDVFGRSDSGSLTVKP